MDEPREYRVSQGGVLATDRSADAIGPENYSSKQNWRREGDYEIEIEGWQYYQPNSGGSAVNQKNAFLPNGQFPVVLGSGVTNPSTGSFVCGSVAGFGGHAYSASGAVGYAAIVVDTTTSTGYWSVGFSSNPSAATAPASDDYYWLMSSGQLYLYKAGAVLVSGPHAPGSTASITYDGKTLKAYIDSTVHSTGPAPTSYVAHIDIWMTTSSTINGCKLRCSSVADNTVGDAAKVFEARRANGQAVHIAVSSTLGAIKWFDYTNSAWKAIGGGYATSGTDWQIIQIGQYVVFNNTVDLPFTWVVGDSVVAPIYELREQGIASVGHIEASNGMAVFSGLTEIKDAELSGVMNGSAPYGAVASNKTERVSYRMTWSNFDDPRDLAAVVTGSINSGSGSLTLAWPMASFTVGTELTILGAGTAGANLVATVSSVSGATISVSPSASTTVSNVNVQRTTALNSVVGYKDLGEDGTAILRQRRLGSRIVAYKAGGEILVGYYTGNIDQPWQYDVAYDGGSRRGLAFPNTLIDVAGKYHIYAGSDKFYTFSLGTQEPVIHPLLNRCSKSLWFSLVRYDAATVSSAYAAVNGITEEIVFAFKRDTTAYALALHYTEGEESVAEITGFDFGCAATLSAPNGDKSANNSLRWFVLGGRDGTVSVFGLTSSGVLTMTRHGSSFARTIAFGANDFGNSYQEKHLGGWFPLLADSASGSFQVQVYGKSRTTQAYTLLSTKAFGPDTPGIVPLHFQKTYFRDIVTGPGTGAKLAGRTFLASLARGRGVTRIKP